MVVVTELSTGWKCKRTDDAAENAWMPVSRVPTTIHLDLMENDKIPDPFIDMNELAVRWVAEKSWTYRTTFPSPEKTDDRARTDLVFKGLDTFARVSLNGQKILEADNMFLEYRVEVGQLLKPSDGAHTNDLQIVFDSALVRGRELVKQHEHEHDFIAHQTEQSRLPVRKAQCHWGWDWGPILVTAGPWRPILLETYVRRIDDVWFQAVVSPDLATVSGKLLATADVGNATAVKFNLSLEGTLTFESQVEVNGQGLASTDFHIERPALWNPYGHGQQSRYKLTATLLEGDAELTSTSKLVGFRRCQLIQEKDQHGKSFYFRINNVDVFCGGSCWIPADSFIPRVGRDGYRKWMQLMIEGNQNMTRVWGGGIYEEDDFFDMCDELGILVWQDFCFACASYPTYPSFLKQVEHEARYNVRRLRCHPSLTIWAGNNEDYQIQEQHHLDYDYDGDKDPQSWLKSSFPARYIYEYLLPKVVEEEDPGAVYHPSSPWGDGKKTSDPTVGDIHQWNVWHGGMRRYQEFPTMGGRFVSEFGMEAYPHLSTIKSAVTNPRDQRPGSMVMDYHNRANEHERRLLTYVAENFRIKYDLDSFTHLTQITQADAVMSAYRAWRRDWGQPGHSRKCGGVLVWQLNDCWPTMSWAVVDYHAVPKPAFYAIRRALKPVVVGVTRPVFHEWTSGHADPTVAARDNTYDLWVTSSGAMSGEDDQGFHVDVTVRFISIKTGKDVAVPLKKSTVRIRPNATTEIISRGDVAIPVPLPSSSPSSSTPHEPFDPSAYDPIVIHASIARGGKVLSTDTAWPQPFKYLDFSSLSSSPSSRKDGVQVSLSADRRRLTVSAKRPVHGFVIEEPHDLVLGDGDGSRDGDHDRRARVLQLSDNGFDVVPGDDVVVHIYGGTVGEGQVVRWRYIGSQEEEGRENDGESGGSLVA